MGNLLIIGNTLVHPDEYQEKKQIGNIDEFIKSFDSNKDSKLDFTTGSVNTKEIRSNFEKVNKSLESSTGEVNPSTPIGLGKPLCVEILTIYTGDYPNGLFRGKKDLMLSTAIKSSVTFDSAARAINKIDKKSSEKTYVEFIASEAGTRVVYYTPAVDALNTNVSFELVADTFEQEIFDTVSKLLQSAAGIPIFLPAATFLLGGSHVVKMAGGLGNTLFAKKAYLKDNFEVKFNNAGDFDSIARNVVIFNDADRDAFAGYEARLIDIVGKTKFRLVKKGTENEIYKGDVPYLIINLDGQVRTDLSTFTPKLASSALLQKFYGEDDKQGAITKTIEDAMQLYNDMNYKTKAEKLSKVLKQMPEGPERTKNEALLKAYLANIQNEIFQD